MQRDELSLTLGLGMSWESLIWMTQVLFTNSAVLQHYNNRPILPAFLSVIVCVLPENIGLLILSIFLLPTNNSRCQISL